MVASDYDVVRYMRDNLWRSKVPPRLHEPALEALHGIRDGLRAKSADGVITAGGVFQALMAWCQAQMTNEEKLTAEIAVMTDRQLLEALYRKAFPL